MRFEVIGEFLARFGTSLTSQMIKISSGVLDAMISVSERAGQDPKVFPVYFWGRDGELNRARIFPIDDSFFEALTLPGGCVKNAVGEVLCWDKKKFYPAPSIPVAASLLSHCPLCGQKLSILKKPPA